MRTGAATSRATAAYLVEAIVGTSAPQAGRHVPHMQAGGTGSRAGAAEIAHQRPAIVHPDSKAAAR